MKELYSGSKWRKLMRCNTANFDILGEGDIPIGPLVGINRSLPAFIPGVVVACSNCGFLMYHALAVLKVD
jgi:hypothetical protein